MLSNPVGGPTVAGIEGSFMNCAQNFKGRDNRTSRHDIDLEPAP